VKFYLKEIRQLTTVQKINTEKTELKETKSKSAANSLLKHSGDCYISKEENVPAYVIFSDAALPNGNNKTYER
jgi:ATP-dependent DNA helicase RecQ